MMFFILPTITQWFYRKTGLLRDKSVGKIRLIYGNVVIRVRRLNKFSFERQAFLEEGTAELSLLLLSFLKKSYLFEGNVFVFTSKHSVLKAFVFKDGFFIEIDERDFFDLLHYKNMAKESLKNQIYCVTIKKRVRLC